MNDLLLCVHVVVKTLNLEFARCHLADYVKGLNQVRAARAARLFFLIQPNRSLFYGAVVAFAVAVVLAQTPSRHRFNVVGHKMSRSAAKRRELGV